MTRLRLLHVAAAIAVSCGAVAQEVRALTFPALRPGEVVVVDHVSNDAAWTGKGGVVHYDEINVSSADAIVAIRVPVTSANTTLGVVGGLITHASEGGIPNGGNLADMSFRLLGWPTLTDWAADPFHTNPTTGGFVLDLSDPTNPGYLNSVGTAGAGFNAFYVEADVSALNILLSESDWVFALIPRGAQLTEGFATAVFSMGGIGTIGTDSHLFRSVGFNLGPATLDSLGAPFDFGAFRVTTIQQQQPPTGALPEPCSAMLAGMSALVLLSKRRRDTAPSLR